MLVKDNPPKQRTHVTLTYEIVLILILVDSGIILNKDKNRLSLVGSIGIQAIKPLDQTERNQYSKSARLNFSLNADSRDPIKDFFVLVINI